MEKGEVTAYLSLIFILLISFVGGIMEAASVQMAKNYRRADMNRAIESVFAEYQKELLEEYGIFALEGSYESGSYSEETIKNRLDFYGAQGIRQSVSRIEFLTDHGAEAFCGQVEAYMKHKYGLNLLQDKIGMTDVWKQQEEQAKDCEKDEIKQQKELSGLLQENEGRLPTEENPIEHVEQLKKSSLLDLIMPKDKPVSQKTIDLGDTLSFRELNCGYGDFSDVAEEGGTLTSLILGEYLLEQFSNGAGEPGAGALDYQLEYILAGKRNDRENLEAVAGKLILLRFVPNYMHLQGSSTKKAEAEALALTLCSLLAVPAITEAAAQVILLAWAYGESLMDMRSLLRGNKVPLVKTDDSWQLSLSGLMKLGQEGDLNDGKDTQGGLPYKEYLRILLFLEKKETTAMRALDMIEQNLRTEHGLAFFKADQCISKIEVKSTCNLRRGIVYQFATYFGYH
ncbi:hypothetical protein IMSAGC015_00606 [Lachnospiraceae bacterium]|nr:hypothetical protein IMSAGC015_00606 [Lachnospiraceae bacterium]